jgi:hypothetical protein
MEENKVAHKLTKHTDTSRSTDSGVSGNAQTGAREIRNTGGNMVKNYRKKPVVIQACQWTGDNVETLKSFMGVVAINFGKVVIHTLEGDVTADQNDWIIRGVKGEFYPCKPDIFAATYDAAEN